MNIQVLGVRDIYPFVLKITTLSLYLGVDDYRVDLELVFSLCLDDDNVELVLLCVLCLDDCSVELVLLCCLGVDACRVELALLCFLGLDVCPITFLRGCGHFLFASVLGEGKQNIVVYYESIKREPKIRGINKCRCL